MSGYTIAIYLLVAIPFLSIWLNALRRNIPQSAREKHLSLIALAIAIVFWPVVVPLSYLELLKSGGIVGRDRKFAH